MCLNDGWFTITVFSKYFLDVFCKSFKKIQVFTKLPDRRRKRHNIMMNLIFGIILVLCTLAGMEVHSFAHFFIVFQNFKMIPWWPPNHGECLDRLLLACAAKSKAVCH
jgi:hypothetical protein